MSRESSSPNTVEAAKAYIEWLANLGVAKAIYVAGSRSPLREKAPRKESDWDLVLVTDIEKLKLASPRSGHRLHADLLIISPQQLEFIRKPVMVWPDDPHKVLTK